MTKIRVKDKPTIADLADFISAKLKAINPNAVCSLHMTPEGVEFDIHLFDPVTRERTANLELTSAQAEALKAFIRKWYWILGET